MRVFIAHSPDFLDTNMPKILIIDDEPAIRKALKEILEYEQFEVAEAEEADDFD